MANLADAFPVAGLWAKRGAAQTAARMGSEDHECFMM